MAVSSLPKQPFLQKFTANSRRFIRWITSPYVALSILMLLLMVYLIIIPLYRMLFTTFTFQEKDVVSQAGAVVGQFTLYHWGRMLASKIGTIMAYAPLGHSLVIASGATAIAMALGCMMAWFVVRTDMPGRKLINILAIVPYMMPSWTIAMAWTVLFKNRTIGGAPGLIEFLLGKGPPNWFSYGPVPIMVASGLHYYTFFFLFVSAALISIDSNLEEAGELAGASRWRILRTITFPLIMPALSIGLYYDLLKGDGNLRWPKYFRGAGSLLHPFHHDPGRHADRR